MRFLKNKIALSAQLKVANDLALTKIEVKQEPQVQVKVAPVPVQQTQQKTKEPSNRGRKKTSPEAKEEAKSTKTVVKNYGKAIASFAMSPVAIPYLSEIMAQNNVKHSEFVEYVGKAKESIEGIDTFRSLLLVKDNDHPKIAAFKIVFQSIAETFINSFSVNWIYSGRMMNKKVHLKLRFKILRRIQNPELFTYLK